MRRKLPRRERRKLERERKKIERKRRILEQRKNLSNRQKEQLRSIKKETKQKSFTPSILDAERAKKQAQESLKQLKLRLIELQHKVHHSSSSSRNRGLNLITKINNHIKQYEDLIEVYEEWINRETGLQKLAKKVVKPKK